MLGWVAELMNGNSRETALMELSKKREQVPELALIIWHSFGRSSGNWHLRKNTDSEIRCHGIPFAGDYFGLSAIKPFTAYCSGFQPSLQCLGSVAVCGFSQ